MRLIRGYSSPLPAPLADLPEVRNRAAQVRAVDRWLAEAERTGYPDLLGRSVVDAEREFPYADRLSATAVSLRTVAVERIVGGGWASIPRAWRCPGGPYAHLALYPNPQRLRYHLLFLLGWEEGEIEPLLLWNISGYLISRGDDHYLYAARVLGRRLVVAEVQSIPYADWLSHARIEMDALAGQISLIAPNPSRSGIARFPLTEEQSRALVRRFRVPVRQVPVGTVPPP